MTKAELIEAIKVWLSRIEDGEIFDDIEMDESVRNDDILKAIARLISDELE